MSFTFIKKILYLFLFLVLALHCVIAQVRINYQGEHRNYGDQAKIKEHVKNHLKEVEHPPDEISDDDELYYLFSIHDTNQDGYLDGHELRGAFTDEFDNESDKDALLKIDEIVEMIDHALLEDDMDNDGRISWEEYLLSQKYHEA
ncbi:9982_t:CDS:2 [Dentiscutata erythropus]|uniref:9982_t:CDS:1 n=1 Tax=Dentiscutata erythropus TaxID=1348616 RepID=A0A9N9CV53_9GLOM|nr:9982_t:CDS:2 [Dentiscutata erythropus]